LNPRPRRTREREEVAETPAAVQEVAAVEETTAVAEEQPAAQSEENTYQGERKRKQPVEEEKPIAPEDLLERPDNALSLAEYREQLKEKNRKIQGSTGSTQLNVQLPSEFKILEKETFAVKAKPSVKPAQKKENVQEIAVVFKTEDGSSSFQRRDYGKKQQTKTAPKIRFEDLPSL